METSILANQNEQLTETGVKKIVVGYDASPAAECALHDAITLGRHFQAEVVLAQVNAPDENPASSFDALRDERMQQFQDLQTLRGRLAKEGVTSRSIVRNGIVGDTLFNICCDEEADLLLLGAYGYRQRDRQTLGSTAEFLLRAIPCPALTYGPDVRSTFDSLLERGPVLVPVSLPCNPGYLESAIKIATLFDVGIEILHVAGNVSPTVMRDLENECQRLSYRLRCGGIHAQWSLYCGKPEQVIKTRASEIDSPFILIPLRWGHRLSSLTSDNVAAHVIRCSRVPVMTYRTS